MIDPSAAPYLRALTVAEDAMESELARVLDRWERGLAIPERGPEMLRAWIAAQIARFADVATQIQRQGWAQLEAKDVQSFQAARAEYAQAQAGRMIVGIEAETRQRIAAIIARAGQQGLGPDAIRKEIAALVEGIGGRSARQRAAVIARTELHQAGQWAQEQEARALARRGADLVKVWTATLDKRTRPAHRMANGQVRELREDFLVGGRPMARPGDVRGGPQNTIQCRCVARHIPRRQVADDRQRRARAMAPALTTATDRIARLDPRAMEVQRELMKAIVTEAARLYVRPGRPLAVPAVDGVQPPRIEGARRVFGSQVDGLSALYVASLSEAINWDDIAAAWAAAAATGVGP